MLTREVIYLIRRDINILRRALILKVYKDYPQLTIDEIGQIFHVSRQRIHQILTSEKDHEQS